jgi:DNA polymerase-3 subunit delta'
MFSWLTKPLQEYNRMREMNRLPHAILLCAPEGVGAGVLAREFARSFLCLAGKDENCNCHSCSMLKNNSHPDLTVVDRRNSQSIGVDAMRQGINSLVGTPTNGHGRVLLINQANCMTVQASNALLKTLEEPAGNTLIVLTTENIRSILPTIISRSMRVQVNIPDISEFNEFLKQQTSSDRDFSVELYVSGMSPLKVLDWIDNRYDEHLHACLELFEYVMRGDGDIRKLASELEALSREDSSMLYGLMYAVIKDVMGYQSGISPENLKILRDKEALGNLASIHPDSLSEAARKVIMLKGAGVGPTGIKNSIIGNLQLLNWLELLRGY